MIFGYVRAMSKTEINKNIIQDLSAGWGDSSPQRGFPQAWAYYWWKGDGSLQLACRGLQIPGTPGGGLSGANT